MLQESFPNFEDILDGLEILDKIIVFRKNRNFQIEFLNRILSRVFVNIQFLRSEVTNHPIMSDFVTLVPCYTGIILQISHWTHVTNVIWTKLLHNLDHVIFLHMIFFGLHFSIRASQGYHNRKS